MNTMNPPRIAKQKKRARRIQCPAHQSHLGLFKKVVEHWSKNEIVPLELAGIEEVMARGITCELYWNENLFNRGPGATLRLELADELQMRWLTCAVRDHTREEFYKVKTKIKFETI